MIDTVIRDPEITNMGGGQAGVYAWFVDSSTGVITDPELIPFSVIGAVDAASFNAIKNTAINAYIATAGYTITHDITPFVIQSPTPSSYQTIVTQTGTAAPAVSGSLVPTSTYPAGTTFTWARTGAGVYTLTASSAVFNTSGKTGVFVGSLNNPNGAWKAVVTSSTVITLTTSLQSLAVLGLLGFTGTPTDALLTQTMVYVQTYS